MLPCSHSRYAVGVLAVVLATGTLGRAAKGAVTVLPESATTLAVIRDGEAYLDLHFVGWGPGWGWLGIQGTLAEAEGGAVLTGTARTGNADVTLTARVRQTGPRQVTLVTELRASADVALTCFVLALEPGPGCFPEETSKATVTAADGTVREVPLPWARKGLGDAVGQIALSGRDGDVARITLDPPRAVPTDGAARIVLAGESLKAASPALLTLTLDLPQEVTFYPSAAAVPPEAGDGAWFPFQPDTDYDRPSETAMEDWLEAPAGRHGRITRQSDRLLYKGEPIKLWGLNLCFGACAPEPALAERRARFYARHGINAVRLHKWADGPGWAGIQSKDSFAAFEPAALDRMDYQVAQFKQHGIYVKLSAHFGAQRLGAGDREAVPYLDEFGALTGDDGRVTPPHSAVHYAPELQDLQIRQIVTLLRHRNPHTGLTYAEDPAVAFIEIINEQSILFYSSMQPLKISATLRQRVARQFCAWLRERYGTHAKLAEAWGGQRAFDGFEGEGFAATGEHLDKDNILPLGNPWFWAPAQLDGSQAFRKRRLLDTLRFLYELQNQFYDRYVAAVREAGYAGELVASNWQAGEAYSHYYNLHSDARIGTIDRHNYAGGGSEGRIDNATMLRVPGSGILSSGMQQVAGLPFMLSEWISVAPNEWGSEGPAIVGAYGMGLQGWDVSFIFQNRDNGSFAERLNADRWEVTAPQVLGLFPAVSRQVLRGDVLESGEVVTRAVHVPSLGEPRLGFDDRVSQQRDTKSFGGATVPSEALGAVRCLVEFADTFHVTAPLDLSRFQQDGWLVASTGQLRWRPGTTRLDGGFTIDTPATKAAVGFHQGRRLDLGSVTLAPACRYAALYLVAKDPKGTIDQSRDLLLVALARCRNTGMKVFNDDRLLARGNGPVRLEPVKARITLRRPGTPTVVALDHNGRRTATTLPVENGSFEIDGSRDRTCYYLVSYP